MNPSPQYGQDEIACTVMVAPNNIVAAKAMTISFLIFFIRVPFLFMKLIAVFRIP